MIVGLVASGHDKEKILEMYPYLEAEDIDEALKYAAWRVEEIDVPILTGRGHWSASMKNNPGLGSCHFLHDSNSAWAYLSALHVMLFRVLLLKRLSN